MFGAEPQGKWDVQDRVDFERKGRKGGQTNMTLMQDKYPAFLNRVFFRVMFVCLNA
jgi:hypothetical protein